MTDETVPPSGDNTPPPADITPQAPSSGPSSWRDSLPDDIKSVPTLSKFETIEGLAKSYVNLEKTLGSEKVAIPKDGDTEGWERFYKAAGAPDAPDAYGFKAPEKVPDGMVYNPELDTKIAGIFHGAKLNPQQAAKVREGLMEIVGQGATESLDASKAQEAARTLAIQQGEQSLKAEWRDSYDKNCKLAAAAIGMFLSPETIAVMESAGIANHPVIVKDMLKMGKSMAGEDALIGAAGGDNAVGYTLADTHVFRSKHFDALYNKAHPEHDARLQELTRMTNAAFPDPPAV